MTNTIFLGFLYVALGLVASLLASLLVALIVGLIVHKMNNDDC